MNESMNMRWLRWCLSGIVFFLAVIAVELAALTGSVDQRAMAQIPDSGLQRKQLLDAQDRSNAVLDEILQHLRTQTLKVKVVSTDKEIRTESARPDSTAPSPAPRVIRR